MTVYKNIEETVWWVFGENKSMIYHFLNSAMQAFEIPKPKKELRICQKSHVLTSREDLLCKLQLTIPF